MPVCCASCGGRTFSIAPLPPLALLLIPLAMGEELGWRGYALPRLLQARSPLVASVILGVLWSVWHLPFRLGALDTFPLYLVIVTAWAVLFTWIWLGSAGNLVVASLLHGTFNLSGVLKVSLDPLAGEWLTALVSVAAAALVALAWRRSRPADPRLRS